MAGGIDWFRWHHGSVTDPKFSLVARRAGASLPDVLAVWVYLLERASAAEQRGMFGEVDLEAVDNLFDFDDGMTSEILTHMNARGLIAGGAIAAWEKRQPKRERDTEQSSDGATQPMTSTERSRKHRAEKHSQGEQAEDSNGNATPNAAMQRHATPCNASNGHATPRVEESREEPLSPTSKEVARKRATSIPCPEGVSSQVWDDWHALRAKKRAPVTATTVEGARLAGPAGRLAQATRAAGSPAGRDAIRPPDARACSSPWSRSRREGTRPSQPTLDRDRSRWKRPTEAHCLTPGWRASSTS